MEIKLNRFVVTSIMPCKEEYRSFSKIFSDREKAKEQYLKWGGENYVEFIAEQTTKGLTKDGRDYFVSMVTTEETLNVE